MRGESEPGGEGGAKLGRENSKDKIGWGGGFFREVCEDTYLKGLDCEQYF